MKQKGLKNLMSAICTGALITAAPTLANEEQVFGKNCVDRVVANSGNIGIDVVSKTATGSTWLGEAGMSFSREQFLHNNFLEADANVFRAYAVAGYIQNINDNLNVTGKLNASTPFSTTISNNIGDVEISSTLGAAVSLDAGASTPKGSVFSSIGIGYNRASAESSKLRQGIAFVSAGYRRSIDRNTGISLAIVGEQVFAQNNDEAKPRIASIGINVDRTFGKGTRKSLDNSSIGMNFGAGSSLTKQKHTGGCEHIVRIRNDI